MSSSSPIDADLPNLTDAQSQALWRLLKKRINPSQKATARSIPKRDPQDPLTLSFAQQRMWFLAQLDERAGAAYAMPGGVRLRGALNAAALQTALSRIVARHEALRTVFASVEGEPVQVIAAPEVGFALAHVDLSGHAEPEVELERIVADEAAAPFDLAHGPLIRGRLVRVAQDDHVLLVTMHHIVSDGWSMGVLINEFRALYTAFSEGRPDPLPALAIQYADYAAWQRRRIAGDVLQRQLDFWRDHLSGAPALLELPTDRPRPAVHDYSGASLDFELDAELTANLKALSQRHGTTLFMTLLAAWGALLARLSGQTDVVIGTPVANRHRAELEPLIGLFINTQALRIDLSGSPSVAQLLAQVRATALAAQDHQDIPFEQVVEALHPLRSLAHSPVFQVLFAWQNAPEGDLELPGLQLQPLGAASHTVKFDLELSLQEAGERIAGSLGYASALFDAGTVERHLAHWRTLLRAMVADDAALMLRLPLLSGDERHQLVHAWNATEAAFPAERCIHTLFEDQVARTPEATALVFEDGSLSYAELNGRANRLAHRMIDLGVRRGDCVALALPRSADLVTAELAVLKCGAAYVPLDPEHPDERLRFVLADCGARALLCHSDCTLEARVRLELDRLDTDGPDAHPDARAGVPVHAEDAAYVMYTSGSTGVPKGVVVPHRAVLNLVLARDAAFGHDDRVAFASNPAFDSSTLEVWGALLNGAAVVVVPQPVLLDPLALAQLLGRERVTVLILVAGVLRAYAPVLAGQLPTLRTLVTGGDVADANALATLLGKSGPQQVLQTYGPTETTQFVTTLTLREPPAPGARIPIGRPIANARLYILDAHGAPAPLGVAGEIHIGGAGVAHGYLNRPDLTAERFVPDPFAAEPGARLYKTGDLGRWRVDSHGHGTIEFLGRNDQQVKIRGFRIEPGEIEAALLQHPAVRAAMVAAREDAPGDKRLVAYVVGENALPPEALRAHLAASLPEYMVPAAYVQLDALPLTPNGKLNRRALPAPEGEAYAQRAYEAPQGELESTIAAIWGELLGVERVGRHDDFFALGGHSLLAVQLASRIRARLGSEVALAELFAQPTLTAFAERVAAAHASTLPAIVPAAREGALPLSFAQQRLWFLAQLDERAGAAYAMPGGVRLRGALDAAALQTALAGIVARHEALRTVFASVEGEPVQVIAAPEVGFALVHVDLSGHAEPEVELERIAADEAAAPLDLAHGPLIRGRLVRLAQDDHVLLVTMHHIVSDGWSMGVLLNEFSALYAAFSQGRPDPLPALAIQYADYAAWQRRWIAGDVLQRQLDFWRDHLSGAPALLELPTDRSRPAVQDYSGASLDFELDAELTAALKALGRRHGTTLFMTLLAAWGALLARLSGQTDVVIGTPVANRHHAELEPLIGFFVNTQALRIDLSGSPSVAQLLAQVRATALAAQDHQDIPFEQVVEALQPLRSLAHSPVFQVMFSWQNAPEGDLELPGLQLRPLGAASHTVRFDLELSLQEAGERIAGSLGYACALFDAPSIERHLGHWRTLLRAMVADDAALMPRLPLWSGDERHQLLHAWNATEAAFPAERCIHELFEDQVARTPEATALVCEDGTLSYAELNARANRLAHHLIALGLGPDDRVAICAERGASLVVGLLAILKAGAGYVALDADYPAERLAFMLADSAPRVLLTQRSVRTRLPAFVDTVDLDDPDAWQHQPEANRACDALTGAHLAYVIYTSGSTGTPKGVQVVHASLVNYALAAAGTYALAPADRVLQASSVSFDIAVDEIFTTLAVGATLVLAPWPRLPSIAEFSAFVERQQLTVLNLPTAYWHEWVAALQDAPQPLAPSLRLVVVGGEAASAQRHTQWCKHAGERVSWLNCYGPTETTAGVTFGRVAAHEPVHIGGPIAHTRIYLLDAWGEPVPLGVAGEIHIGGAPVARGYLNRPDLTAERFLPDPFAAEPGARLYRTGDLARWRADGTLEFLVRNDQQVKIRGFRIEPAEIEAALLRHPAVRAAVVAAREDAPGDKRLVAYVVGEDTLAPQALRGHLGASLPEYMIPAAFVQLPALPLTPNGKLDRRALPAPEGDAFGTRAYEAPQGELETALAALWSELLGVERIGRHDDFFALGGHSLLAVRLIERMRSLGWQLEVRSLFTSPILADLAATVDSRPAVRVPPNLIGPACERITPELLPLVALTPEQIAAVVATVPGGAANVQDIYPLAPLQEGILFHHLAHAAGDPYLLQHLLAFDARSQLDRFLNALQSVIDRHDILRTAFVWQGLPEPVQMVWRRAPLPVEELMLDGPDVAGQLSTRFDAAHTRLDVRQAPLLSAYVAQDAEHDRWLLCLLQHHLVGDHTTTELLVEEVQAHLVGQAHQLPPPLPFRDFIAQARLGLTREQHETFFREMLADIDEPTAPFGLLDAHGDGSDVHEVHLPLDPDLARQLREHARRLGVSAASVFHLAWALVLARTSGRADVVFGTVLFGRMQGGQGAHRVLGLFMNTLPLRLRLDGTGVEAAVRATHARLAQLLHHEHAPLALAQRASGVPAPAPLFTALLNYRYDGGSTVLAHDPGLQEQAWDGVQMLHAQERTNYPLTLSVNDAGEDFSLDVQVDQRIDAQRVGGFMLQALQALAHALERAPASPVSTLDVLPAAERHQLVHAWNATDVAFPVERCIHELFEAQVHSTPEATALVFEKTTLSYAELNAQANRLAHHLITLGVGPDTRVAIALPRGIDMVVALLATLKAGGAYVPLDPNYPTERLAFMLADSAPRVLLTQAAVRAALTGLPPSLVVLELDASARSWEALIDTNPQPTALQLEPSHLAYVIYTSGSTGQPKGVTVEHRSVVNFLGSMLRLTGIGPQDRLLAVTTLAFDIAGLELFLPLSCGACIVIADHSTVLDPVRLAHSLQALSITALQATPALWRMLLDSGWSGLPHLKALCGGEALPSSLAASLAQRTQRLWNVYGPTETTIWSSSHVVTAADALAPLVSIGRPIANTRMYVLDEHGAPAPVGVAGELYIGGAGVARGYLNRPDLTAERFVPDPFAAQPGARLYKTGDLGRWRADGTIEFLGRNDHQVKIRGFRIELAEIEARLLQLPGVREAVVLARENSPGNRRLVAYVTGEKALEPEALRAHLAASLPEYMVPAAYVQLDALPLTPNGKLDRRALPAPEGDAFGTRTYEAPQGELETALAAIWGELLGVEHVGRHDDFFALGGHSLLAVQLASSIRARLGAEVPLADLFAQPTLAGFAERVGAAHASTLPAIVPAPRDGALPLSPVQERLWVVQQMQGLQSSYNMALALQLQGPLSVPALQAAFDALLARHEVLRTRFVADADGRPQQVVEPAMGLHLHVLQTSHDEVPSLAAAHAAQVFDLSRAPLLSVQLLQLGEHEHVLLFNMHHIISDGWSMNVLAHEMQQLYAAQLRGELAQLPALSVQYADYAYWLAGQDMQPHAAYWAQQLHGYESGLTLPLDRPAQPGASATRTLSLDYPAELSAALGSLCEQHTATLFMALTAALGVVLQRYTGRRDLCLGTTVAGRERAELEPLIGFFINIVALRLDLSGDVCGSELLERVKRTVLRALEHQALPFEQVLQQLKLSGDRAPELVPVMVRHQNVPDTVDAQWGDQLTVELLPGQEQGALCPLDLQFFGDAQGLRATVAYAADLFDEGTVRRLLQHHQHVLQQMVQQPQQPLSLLQLLTTDERQLIERTNRTARGLEDTQSVVALFEQQVQASPEACACIDAQGQLSYSELNVRANRIAHALRARGVGAEVRVGLYMPRSCDFIAAMLGIFKSGGVYVPLDVNAPSAYLQRLIDDVQPQVVMHGAQQLEAACLGTDLLSVAQAASQGPETNLSLPWHPQQLMMLAYTSGSTGVPKGVLVPHGQLLNLLRSMQTQLPLAADDIVAQKTMAPFVVSMKELLGALLAGVPQVVVGDALLKDPPAFIAALQRGKVSRLFIVPSHLQAVLDALDDPQALSHLRVCVTAGEPLTQQLRERVQRTLPWVALWNNFGCTELNDTTYCDPAHLGGAGQFVPIGWPIDNVQVHVLDERLRELPLGVAGELCVHYPWMARGYWRQPELTAERFVPHPYGPPGSRLYRTGDLVRRLADGSLEYLGREDFDIKIRGQRVDVRQVEAALAACEGVHLAAVGVWRDDSGDTRLVGYVVPPSGQPLQAAQLRRQLAAQLPAFMVPSLYVALQALPRTSTGKLDRRALPAPQADALAHQTYAAPQTDTEHALAAIWSRFLELPVERIGRDDDFFALGGHSLLATRIAAHVQQALQRPLQLEQVFTHVTLRELAAHIDALAGSALLPPIEPRGHQGDVELSFAQQRLWFLHRWDSHSSAYHNIAAVKIDDRLDEALVERTLHALVRRHEALRTSFPDIDGRPVQRVAEDGKVTIECVDLSGLDRAACEAQARAASKAVATRAFDLAHGPLLRLQLVRLGTQETLLTLVVHHIVADGWSMDLLVKELLALYDAYSQEQPDPLAPLAIQYPDYAQWQRRYLQGELLQRQQRYWTEQLADAPVLHALPTDRPRPAMQSFRGLALQRRLDGELTEQLRAFAQSRQLTPFMVLLSTFKVLLWRYSGQTDVVVGTPVANRHHPGLERLIGMFANTLALRSRLEPTQTFADLLVQVRRTTLQAQAHQDLPFEHLVELLRVPRSSSHSPLFQVMFSLLSLTAQRQQDDTADVGADWEDFDTTNEVSQFDLTLSLQESSQGFAAKWEFNSDLFDTATIERMAGHFERLLRHALAEPQRCIGQLPLLDEAERDQLLVKWNDTAIAGPAQRTIHELFEDQVARTPKATALVFEDDSLTYAQLNARANRLAHHLIALGVGPDTCVAIALPRGIEMVVALLATLKAGGAYVPLDPDYPTERLAFMLADSAPRVLITQATGRAALGLLLPSLAVVELDTAARPWDGMPDTNPDARALGLHPSHLAYVIYTSGSTGMPKGVAIEHRSAANLIEWARASFEPSVLDRTLFSTSLNFDLAVFECFVPLCSGAAVCLVRNALVMQNSPQEVTLINTVPSALSALVDAHAIPQSVHTVNVAGEPLKRELVQRIFDHSSVHTVCNLYGPSETTTYSTWCAMDRTTGFHPSIGRPIAHTRIYILDAHGALVPAGVAGEIHIGGAGVARGYLNRPDLTAERFVPDPFAAEPGARLYKTGDLGRWRADGTIEFLGRNDHQVKIRGFRIELGEIEARLLELPGVREAAVLAREDLPGEKRLVAYVAGENALQPEALRTHLGASLPEYMVPAAYVQLDALPLTPNGKLDRRALPAPEGDAYGTRAYEAPQGELESTFAAIWSELLGVERIGRHDNFFALGGHSLLALQAVSRLSRRLGREVPVHVLFSTPTVAALAHEIGKPDGPEEFRHIVTIRSSGSHAPLFIIHAGDGEVGYAFDLAPHLPADRPLYALAAIGFADGEAPLSDVEAMASAYVRAMRSVQPHGPYHLVGWSSGGMIAYEIAAQLLSADEQVGFVGVIDTLRDFSSGGAQALTEAQFLVRTVLKDVEGNLARQIAALAEQDDIDAIFDLCQSEGIIPATIERATLRRHLAVRYAIGLAVANYRAQPIAVPLALFTAADEGHADSRLGWAEITEHGLDVAELPGTHWSIVDPDHIRALGAAISRALVAGTRGSFATRDAGPAASVS